MLDKYDEEKSCEMAEEWIKMESTQIEEYLRGETKILECKEAFFAITSYSTSSLGKVLDMKCIAEKENKRIEIIIKFINNVFENISDKVILEILKNWRTNFLDGDFVGEMAYRNAKERLYCLPYQEISNRVRKLFLQIDNTLVIGANGLIRKFAESKGKTRLYTLKVRNLQDFIVGLLDESDELILYNLSNDSKCKIPISEIVNYQYQQEENKEQIKIYTKNTEYSEIIFISDRPAECEEIRKIYRQMEENFNNKDTDDESNTDRNRLLEALKELFTLGIISETEYIEKREKVRDKL